MLGAKDAIRIVPYFVLPQFYPIFAYREAYAPLLCSYRGGSLSHKTTPVQAHRGFRLLTLASTYYNITLFLSVNIGTKLLVSRQISDDIKQFSYEICQRHSVIIRYMETEHVELAHINQNTGIDLGIKELMYYFCWKEIRKSKNHQKIRKETGETAKAVSPIKRKEVKITTKIYQ